MPNQIHKGPKTVSKSNIKLTFVALVNFDAYDNKYIGMGSMKIPVAIIGKVFPVIIF